MPISRLKDSGQLAGAVKALDATKITGQNLIVTPVRTNGDRLKLISWSYTNAGVISRLNDSGNTGPTISNVACPHTTESRIITAIREGGDFALLEWTCDQAGKLSLVTSGVSDSTATAVGAAGGAYQGQYTTAKRQPTGKLLVRCWKEGGAPIGSGQAGEIVSLGRPVCVDATLMTPVVLACNEKLRLIAWSVAQNGTLTRTGHADTGAASRVSLAHIGGKWATAVRTGSGRLELIFWEINGGVPKRIGDSGLSGIEIIDVDCQGVSYDDEPVLGGEAEWRVVTAARTKSYNLRLMTWSWKPSTGKVTLDDDSGDQPEQISLLRLTRLGGSQFITTIRDNATATDTLPGHLKLITWNVA